MEEQRKRANLYYAMIKAKGKGWSWELRYQIVITAKDKGVSGAAREFKTTRKTVRKWLIRFKAQGSSGLTELSRRPKRSPRKTKAQREEVILGLRDKHVKWGPFRLKDIFQLPETPSTIGRVLKRNGRIKTRERKWRKKKDLRLIKAKLKALGKLQVDVKYLTDIPRYLRSFEFDDLPRFEWTARDVRTGGVFLGYSWGLNLETAKRFADELLGYLKSWGVNLTDVTIQVDHGSEFDMSNPGRWAAPEKSAFIQKVISWGANYQVIPIKRPTFNSDVESFHRLVEEELYDSEDFHSLKEFLNKTLAWNLNFNCFRRIRYRGNKTPLEIWRESGTTCNESILAAWRPLLLDPDFKEKEEKVRTQREERENQTLLSLVDTMS